MKYKIAAFALMAVFQMVMSANGDDSANDDTAALIQMHALETKSQNAKSIEQKKDSAEQAYTLVKTTFERKGVSKTNRSELAVGMCGLYSGYLRAVSSSTEMTSFGTSASASNSLAALELALLAVDTSPLPTPMLNVSPPEASTGIIASGMDPKSIQDPKVRAEYEQRIARNSQLIEESNNRFRLQRGIADLEDAIRNIAQGSEASESAVFKSLIQESRLQPKIKADLLKDK